MPTVSKGNGSTAEEELLDFAAVIDFVVVRAVVDANRMIDMSHRYNKLRRDISKKWTANKQAAAGYSSTSLSNAVYFRKLDPMQLMYPFYK